MIVSKYHKMYSNKIRKNFKVVQLSDLHYNDLTDPIRLIETINKINKEHPDYIIFCGDILHGAPKDFENLIIFFRYLGNIAPTYITYGNHDITPLKKDNDRLFSILAFNYGIEILDNEQVYIDDYNVLLSGIDLDYEHYEEHKEDPKDFIEYVNYYFPRELIDKNSFNELICHSPKVIMQLKYLRKIYIARQADLIHSGHMHNGAIPYGLGLLLPKNRGLIDQYRNLFPDLARGKVKIGKTTGIIGGPLTALAETEGIKAKIINKVIPSRMDVIKVLRKK